MSNTPEEVIAAIRSVFPGSDATAILGVLELYGGAPHEREKERVQLAIIALSQGSEDKLLDFVQIAKTDYRDILQWHATGPLNPEQGEQAQQAAHRLLETWGRK